MADVLYSKLVAFTFSGTFSSAQFRLSPGPLYQKVFFFYVALPVITCTTNRSCPFFFKFFYFVVVVVRSPFLSEIFLSPFHVLKNVDHVVFFKIRMYIHSLTSHLLFVWLSL